MPSSSFAFTALSNVGPLTTTFTPPPSCTSSPLIAYADPSTSSWYRYVSCQFSIPGCTPSGTSGLSSTASENFAVATIPYYSPGYICPSGWKTVGTAVHQPGDTDSSWTPSVTGAFQTAADWTNAHVEEHYLAPPYALANGLEPGETAVGCCPSSMTYEPVLGCYSVLPSYTISEGCRAYHTAAPYTTVEPEVDSATDSRVVYTNVGDLVTTVISFDPEVIDKVTALQESFPVFMVHRSSDVATLPTATPAPTSTSSPSHTSNVAARAGIRVSGTNWGEVNVLLGFVTVAMTVGAAMVML